MHTLQRYARQTIRIRKFVSSLSTRSSTNEKPKYEPAPTWNKSIADAEKVIGYPTSFLNLRWLLSDEVANVAVHLRKLLGTNHPLLSIAKDLIMNTETPSWGLIVLLVAKIGGQNTQFNAIDKDITAGVLHSQRILAEITEMLRTSQLIHKQVIYTNDVENNDELNLGNKLAILSGDYLLSRSYNELAMLRNQELNELISSGLRDMTQSEFLGSRDIDNKPLPAKPVRTIREVDEKVHLGAIDMKECLGDARSEWALRSLLNGVSLLAKSCQGTMLLLGHGDNLQTQAFLLGKYIGFILQLKKEVLCKSDNLCLVSAPVLFYLKENPDFYDEIVGIIDSVDTTNYIELNKKIRASRALEETEKIMVHYARLAEEILNKFPKSEAKTALANILKSVSDE